MKTFIIFLFGFVITFIHTTAQTPTKKEIKQAWRNIPINIEECVKQLNIIFSDSAKLYFAAKKESAAASEFNIVQGMAVRNNWKLWWNSSVLSKYFNGYRIYDPEEMSNIIFASFHRKLNNKPINFEEQVNEYFALVERMKANPPKATDNFNIGDTVLTNQYEKSNMAKTVFGKQRGSEIKALILSLDTINQTFKLMVLEITSTTGNETERFAQLNFDNQVISKGTVLWTDVNWWRKKGELFQIHIDP